nr:MlaD family protein [uncultured Lichenicoccus sp.]
MSGDTGGPPGHGEPAKGAPSSGGSGQPPASGNGGVPEAGARPTRFSLIWLIPIIVVAIGAWLGWQTISRRGPEITIQFDDADGLTAGQTQVKHKSVGLGTVEGIGLSKDLQHVEVRVQMSSQSAPLLTKNAKFWVVRPRLSGASVSGLDTLISGAFIAIDPGKAGEDVGETHFIGLDSPPGVRSDEPGQTFTLMTGSLGSLGQGSPVFFRDLQAGEVLGYKLPANGRGPIPVQVFVKHPYDGFLRRDTRFWDVSGLRAEFGGGGLHLQVESLQALISGGVEFGLPSERRDKQAEQAPGGTVFKLYQSKQEADTAGYHERVHVVTYLRTSVKGLDAGSPVEMFGIQVGEVTEVKLQIDRDNGDSQVRVAMEVQPERVLSDAELQGSSVFTVIQAMVNRGLRAETDTDNLLFGSAMISLAFVPKAEPEKLSLEGGAIVLPSQPGGMAGIMDSLSTVSAKLAALPLSQIGDSLSSLLAHADATVASPQLKQALVELNQTLASTNHLVQNADHGLTPFLQRLPQISDQLQKAIDNANGALASYGGNSDFHNSLQRTLDQLNSTARSIRSLTDYLNRHPSSLIFGRSNP